MSPGSANDLGSNDYVIIFWGRGDDNKVTVSRYLEGSLYLTEQKKSGQLWSSSEKKKKNANRAAEGEI